MVKVKAFLAAADDADHSFLGDFDFDAFPAGAFLGYSADIGFPDCATFLGTFSDEFAFGDCSFGFLGDFAGKFVATFLEVFPDDFDCAFPDNSEAFPDDD
jgi:hypothetical protein